MENLNKKLDLIAKGHPFPWASYDFEEGMFDSIISDDSFEEAEIVRARFAEEFMDNDDGSKDFSRLVQAYDATSEEYRMVIDGTLIMLCGWSLPSLVKMFD